MGHVTFRKAIRSLSYLSAFMGFLTSVKSPPGILGGILWLPKLWAGSWAPFLAILGALGAFISYANKDQRSFWSGVAGMALGIRYTLKVTSEKDCFRPVFGPNWQERIPLDMINRLPASRYQLIQPAPPPMPGLRNLQIGETGDTHHPLLCDLWEPTAGVHHTGLAVIYLHGGLWQAFDKDFLTRPLFRRLAGQGHVVMDVAYSLSPEADLDCMLRDVRQAILWMKQHAAEYGVNPDRIVLMGVSGGAHLALLSAYAPSHPAFRPSEKDTDMRVRGVISISGITDLCAFFREYGRANPGQPEYSWQISDKIRPHIYDRTWFDRFMTRSRVFPAYRHGNMPGGPLLMVYLLGGTLNEIPEIYRSGSPITHTGPHCPPTLHIYAEDDFVVNVSQGRRLHGALRAAGADSIYIELPGTVHAFDQYFGVSRRVAPAAQSVAYDLDRFLALMV